MKTTIITLVIILLSLQSSYSQGTRFWGAVLKPMQKNIPIYNNCFKTKVKYHVMNDTIKETYYDLQIFSKKGRLFKVRTISTMYLGKINTGWIDLKFVGTYFRSRAFSDYPIYDRPDKRAKFRTITYLKTDMINVTDVSGVWVKVSFLLNDKVIIGWVLPEYLCPDAYASCT